MFDNELTTFISEKDPSRCN